jgi:hypothetical protein
MLSKASEGNRAGAVSNSDRNGLYAGLAREMALHFFAFSASRYVS